MKRPRKTRRVAVRITFHEKTALEQLAIRRDVPFSQLLREAVKTMVAASAQ